MNKFRLLTVFFIFSIIAIAPIGLLFVPCWGSKLSPLLNLVGSMDDLGNTMSLGGFAFVDSDEDSVTLALNLNLNNSGGAEMLFPALNVSFKYGASYLGYGWLNPAVPIPAGAEEVPVTIYARMDKGDAFNQFLLSLVAGGLSLSISSAEVFVFLETFGGIEIGAISIPLPDLPLGDLGDFGGGASIWPPTIHQVFHDEINPNQPFEIQATVSDRGGGVKTVTLYWTNGTGGWQAINMTGLPIKPLMGGNTTELGGGFPTAFPNYPGSPIPTTWTNATVNATIPGHPVGTTIHYNISIIDDFGYSTLVPTTMPNIINGTDQDVINLNTNTFNFTIEVLPLSNYTARWVSTDGGAEGVDLLATLEESGINIMDALMKSSTALGGLLELDIENLDIDLLSEVLFDVIIPMVAYFEMRGVNPFEVIDQLLGLSGGIPGIDDPATVNIRNNANESLALDLLAEAGVSLLELMELLDVNVSKLVDSLGESISPILAGGSKGDVLFNLLNETFNDNTKNASFYAFLEANDAFYVDFPMLVFKNNVTDDTLIDYSAEANSSALNDVPLGGAVNATIYIGTSQETGGFPGVNFTTLNFKLGTPGTAPGLGDSYHWEYYDGAAWSDLPILVDETENLTKSGRIIFAPPTTMEAYYLGTYNESGAGTIWVRLNITNPILVGEPIANEIKYSKDFIPYYYTDVNVDLFGRPNEKMIVGVTDSYTHLLQAMNETPGYASKLWSILSRKGVNFIEFVEEIGGEFVIMTGPITGAQILTATVPVIAFFIYSLFLLGVVASVRGRKGTYDISPIRVKKWYESQLVSSTMRTREELEKYKFNR